MTNKSLLKCPKNSTNICNNNCSKKSNLQHGHNLVTSVRHSTADHISTRTPDLHYMTLHTMLSFWMSQTWCLLLPMGGRRDSQVTHLPQPLLTPEKLWIKQRDIKKLLLDVPHCLWTLEGLLEFMCDNLCFSFNAVLI